MKVQSPGAQLNRTDFPQVGQVILHFFVFKPLIFFLIQVVRLPNGELAQVSLTPLGSGSGTPGSAGSTSQAQFPAQPQQPPVVLKPIPTKQLPPAQPQQQQPQQTQQQVVVNAAGQQFLVGQGGAGGVQQQQANAPAAAAGRGQALPQQPGGQGSRPQQQPAVKLVGQAPPVVAQPVPSQQQQQQLLQKQFSPSGGPQPSGPSTTPAPSMQQSMTPSSSSSSALLNALPPATIVAPTVHSTASSVATIARTTSGGAVVRQAAPIPSSVIGSSSLPSVTSVASVNSAVKYPVSSGVQGAFLPALPSYSQGGGGQENLVGENLVERLEDLATRGEEEGKETQWAGELEHER